MTLHDQAKSDPGKHFFFQACLKCIPSLPLPPLPSRPFFQDLITDLDRDEILKGLDEIERRIENNEFNWRADREDVHMNIEAALTDLIGEPAKKLHTARSRNDQVVTDVRLWCRDAIGQLIDRLQKLQVR